jgi:hypothetical protein
VPASSYITEVLADTPRGFWTCQETSGNLADSSGNGLTLTAAGSPTYSNAGPMSDLAVGFTGAATASRAQVSAATDNLTMEAWVYVASLSGVRAVIVNQSAGVGYQMGINASGGVVITLQGVGTFGGNASVPLTTWTHIAVVRDAGTWKAYIDGSLDQANMTTNSRARSRRWARWGCRSRCDRRRRRPRPRE